MSERIRLRAEDTLDLAIISALLQELGEFTGV